MDVQSQQVEESQNVEASTSPTNLEETVDVARS